MLFLEILGQDGSYQFNILGDSVSQEKDTCPGMVHGSGVIFLVSSPIRWVLHLPVGIYGFWEQYHIVKFLPATWTGLVPPPQTMQGISCSAAGEKQGRAMNPDSA